MFRKYDRKIGANRKMSLAMSPDPTSDELMPAGNAAAAGHAADVAARLRRRIATHALPPGSRLREWEVASTFAVPRLTAREALDALVHLGFAERQPNRGVIVKRRELSEVLQLFDLREVNEGLCARLAAHNAAPESWDDLLELFGEPMAAIVARRDLDAYVQTYEMMRRRLIDAAAAPMLGELLTRLVDMTGIYGRRVLLLTDRTQRALADHRALLAALRRGDEMAAEAARRATIANVRASIARYHAYVL
jgi:DNA-binding GntR family transcriptional regulator